MEKATFDEYGKFVLSTTSTQSLDTRELTDRLLELREHTQAHKPVEFSQLLTASIGMQAESGEFSEIIKKIIFQGKEDKKLLGAEIAEQIAIDRERRDI